MKVPSWFSDQLKAEQGVTYRIRWSNARCCFVLEQKAGRGLSTPPRRLMKKLDRMKTTPDMVDEILTRARDGYLLFLEVAPSGRIGCPKCGTTIHLKPQTWEYGLCTACGKDVPCVWFELGGDVLQHLRYIDIHRGGDERIIEDQDRENAAKEAQEKKELKASLTDEVWDNWRQIMSVPRTTRVGSYAQ